MKSIKSKLLTVVLSSVIATTFLLLFISVVAIKVLNRRDSDLLLEYIVRENSSVINNFLESMEKAVDSISYYALEQIAGIRNAMDKNMEVRNEYLRKIEALALTEAKNSRDVSALYFRLALEMGEPSGFIYQYYEGTGRLEKRLPSDIRSYHPTDTVHVGWYYMPKEVGRASWIGPYDNHNLKMRVVSYEIPLKYEGEFIGIVGMDVNVQVTNRDLSKISVYKTGSAILFDKNYNLVYHKSHVRGLDRSHFSKSQEELLRAALESIETKSAVEYNSHNDKLFAIRLRDGMILCITAPVSEINMVQHRVVAASLLGSLLILAVIMAISFWHINSFLRPLNELTQVAEKLADGNMEVSFDHSKEHKEGSRDEIEKLSDTFEIMAKSLKHYFDHFHSLAYTDNMTGLNNKAAFLMTRDVIESEVKLGRASFTLVMMDVNNLKLINDSIGHEKGDLLLKHCAQCMRDVFPGFPLYRIGGDEFCSIINNSSDPQLLIERLQERTANMSGEDFSIFNVSYQIAAGYATFNKNTDSSFQQVFNRADQAMYENKKKLKGEL